MKQRLLDYKKYKMDFWGLIRNSFLIEETKWKKFSYKKIVKRFKMYQNAIIHNIKRTKEKKQNIETCRRLNAEYFTKVKGYYNLLEFVFKIKPSKKLNKICIFFFNRKKRRANTNWWKKKYFIYDVRDLYVKKKRYKYKKEFSDVRLARLFYIIYTYKQLQKIIKRAKRKDGVFETSLISFIECRLPSFIYRAAFLPNMFESIDYIRSSNVAVNKIFRPLIFFIVKIMDIVTFRIWQKGYIYWNLYIRLRKKAFLFFFPKYMYISIYFFFIICLNNPKKLDIINPIQMDFYKASSFIN